MEVMAKTDNREIESGKPCMTQSSPRRLCLGQREDPSITARQCFSCQTKKAGDINFFKFQTVF